jgi:undecaprenyl-diphosphatase
MRPWNSAWFELGPLMAMAAVAAGILGFAMIAGEVQEGDTQAFDRKALLALRNPHDVMQPIGPPAVQEAARDVTALGGVTVLALLIASVGGYFVLDGRTRMGMYVWLSVGSGLVLGTLLKLIFNRPRPDLVPHSVYVTSTSFPSGHSMLAAVSYLTLGTLLASSTSKKRLKIYFMVLALGITVAVGISRVYLGVHWPTDVLAGWMAGAVWAAFCWLAERWFGLRPRIAI